MSWPLASHFSAMLQNPRVAFHDPALQECHVEKDQRNQPRPWSGAFAVVYKGIAPDGRPFAIRVFTTESPERHERYDLINAYLKSRRLRCLVDFEYRDRAIRSAGDGKWYPMILMDWVQGETLFKWVHTKATAGDRRALALSAEKWVGLVSELADARLSHGDLQHANVMVDFHGELILVDYDCMCVPELVGRRNLEVGVEPYQHPARDATTPLSLDLDNYSALVIHVALRGLAADPSLWHKYVERPSHDKLLFRVEDFQSQGMSPLCQDLRRSPDRDVRDLAEQLFGMAYVPLDQVPSLTHLSNSYLMVERLLSDERWSEAVELLNQRGQFRDAPEHLKPLIHQAYENVCRQEAWDTFQKIEDRHDESSDRALTNAWNESLFGGFEPAESMRPRLDTARLHVDTLERLGHLVHQASTSSTFAWECSLVEAAAQLPEGYRHAFESRVAKADRSVKAIHALDAAVLDSDDDEQIVAAWQAIEQAECVEMVHPARQPRIELAKRRLDMANGLRELSENMPPDQFDRRLLDLWQDDLSEGLDEAEPWRPAYERAVSRHRLLVELEDAVNHLDEVSICRLIEDQRLDRYPLPAAWSTTIRDARDRMETITLLLKALKEDDRKAFVQAFDARLIRRSLSQFAPYESLLLEWTDQDVLSLENLGLRPAVARASVALVDKSRAGYRIRWTWPQPRYTDECILVVSPNAADPHDDPREMECYFRVPLDRKTWESGGGNRMLHAEPEWKEAHVIVWSIVDVGFRQFASRPLLLGRLREKRKQSRMWSLFASRKSDPQEVRQTVKDDSK